MLKRFAFGFVALVSSWGAIVACSSSSSPAAPTGSCAQLAVCCLGLPALDQSTCNVFAQSGSSALCTSELSANSANPACGGITPIGTGTGSGTGGLPTTACASLSACCAEMTAPAGCDAVVAAANLTTCATTLQTDEAEGLCTPPVGTGTGSGSGGRTCVAGGGACATFSDCCSGTCANQVCNSCAASGASCAGGEACCSGLTCYNGTCGSCTSDGSACTLASDCCSNICNSGVCQTCASAGSVRIHGGLLQRRHVRERRMLQRGWRIVLGRWRLLRRNDVHLGRVQPAGTECDLHEHRTVRRRAPVYLVDGHHGDGDHGDV